MAEKNQELPKEEAERRAREVAQRMLTTPKPVKTERPTQKERPAQRSPAKEATRP